MKLRVGSRESRLAVIQAGFVMQEIRRCDPGVELELVTMKTTGDKLPGPLDRIGGKGLFIKELDEALLDGRVDLCVHSYKDMPAIVNPDLPVVAVSKREDARDALILPTGRELLDREKPVGCSSGRRRVQLGEIFPGLRCEPVRGNVQTRLDKLDNGGFGALVLAVAGLKRMGLEGRVHKAFGPDEMLPAACQGILAVQMRKGEDTSLLRSFHDPAAWDCSIAERAFVRALGANCSDPVAAYAVIDGDSIELNGMIAGNTGVTRRASITGAREDAARLGEELARKLMGAGE